METNSPKRAFNRLSFDDDEDSGLGMDFGLDMDFEECGDETEQFAISSPLKIEDLFTADDNDDDTERTSDVFDFFDEGQTNVSVKRQREIDADDCVFKKPKCFNRPKKFSKSLSFGDTPMNTDDVISRVLEQDDLIADGSSHYKLPTIKGKHSDLKSITPETMRDVLLGNYNGVIDNYCVIDCRYPFEYEGGHIQGAINLHTKDKISEFLGNESTKPQVLIFHCEFSSERGPKLCRFLRNEDRTLNGENYPALFYPEIYILHGGYKDFYNSCKELCHPRNYVPMLHEDYTSQVRHFRSKSKSWSGGDKRRCPHRLF